jgi:hypothetical protein
MRIDIYSFFYRAISARKPYYSPKWYRLDKSRFLANRDYITCLLSCFISVLSKKQIWHFFRFMYFDTSLRPVFCRKNCIKFEINCPESFGWQRKYFFIFLTPVSGGQRKSLKTEIFFIYSITIRLTGKRFFSFFIARQIEF